MFNSVLNIAGRLIGEGHPVFIIAEIGVNHNGNLQIARKLIDAAVEAGCDAVKFQKRSLLDLYQHKILENPNIAEQSFQYMIPLLREWELQDDDYRNIVQYCKEKKIMFLCTPWDIPSVNFVESLGVFAYKVASADLTNFILLEHIISKQKPLILSTGMSTLDEIRCTVDFIKTKTKDFALLHCNSTYPTPFEEVNLKFIDTLKKEFAVVVGYSGHERGIAISTVAAALGASIIEKHITLDRTMPGPDHAASLEPQGIAKMVRDIRSMEIAMGMGKKHMNRMEILNREVLAKSLIAAVDIPKGAIIKKEMVGAKSPGKGVSVQKIAELIGTQAMRDIRRDEFFIAEDLKSDKSPMTLGKDIGRWGFVFRPDDLKEMERVNPRIVELRFSDRDIELPLSKIADYEQGLVVHCPEYWQRMLLDLSSPDESIRKKSVEITKMVIEKTLALTRHFKGVPKVVVHPGGITMEYIGPNESFNANLEKSLQEMETDGIMLLPENMPPRPWFFGGEYFCNSFLDAEEIKDFCQKHKRRICFDLCHAQLYCNLFKKDIIEYIQQIQPYVEHVHLADAYQVHGEGLQIDEGEIDFKKIIPLLFNGYNYSWIPEIWRGHQNNFAGYYTALERLSKYF